MRTPVYEAWNLSNSRADLAEVVVEANVDINVLLVEDNNGDVLLLKEACLRASLPYRLTRVYDGMEALEQLEQVRRKDTPAFDLIILDLNLPRMDGREVIQHVRADVALTAIPLVILTSSISDQDVAISNGYPLEAYFVKPPTFNELVQVVQKIDHYRQHCGGSLQTPQ